MISEIYKFTSFTTSNCYILRPFNDEICIFVDLPPDLTEPLIYVKENNLSIAGALVTHGHFDHALGMESFQSSIYMNLEDEFLARNPQEQISMFTNNAFNAEKFNGEITTTEFMAKQFADDIYAELDKIDYPLHKIHSIKINLKENHLASASFLKKI